jgi:hypothetical protein
VTTPPPSPKSRVRAVYSVPEERAPRSEKVIYQLEDTGHRTLRLRPTVRMVDAGGEVGYLYRVDAFSRLTGEHLGTAEELAAPGSRAEFAALAREFQSQPFREVVDRLTADLDARLEGSVPQKPVQH